MVHYYPLFGVDKNDHVEKLTLGGSLKNCSELDTAIKKAKLFMY